MYIFLILCVCVLQYRQHGKSQSLDGWTVWTDRLVSWWAVQRVLFVPCCATVLIALKSFQSTSLSMVWSPSVLRSVQQRKSKLSKEFVFKFRISPNLFFFQFYADQEIFPFSIWRVPMTRKSLGARYLTMAVHWHCNIHSKPAFGIQAVTWQPIVSSTATVCSWSIGCQRTSSISWCCASAKDDCEYFDWSSQLYIKCKLTFFPWVLCSMCHVQGRISQGLEVLQFFTTRQWDFRSERFFDVFNKLTPRDRQL